MSTPCVLIIEDDASIRRGLVDALRYAGYETIDCDHGRRGVELALESSIDLVLLDVMLPGQDGFAVLRELRAHRPTLPVVMVTARGAEPDRVRGLKDGADDYIVKPFSALELLARVEAVLRRSPGRPGDVHGLVAGGIMVDFDRSELRCNGGNVSLSERECGILRHLARHRERVIERDELLHHVWGLNPRGLHTRTVDMHVARLRTKLSEAGGEDAAHIIETVRGRGYRLGPSVRIEPAEPIKP